MKKDCCLYSERKKENAGLRQWTRFRPGIEPGTYCSLDNYTPTVLTKYPHDLASTEHFHLGIFKGLAHSI